MPTATMRSTMRAGELSRCEYTRRRVRILFFGSGSPASLMALERLRWRHDVIGVVVPSGDAAEPLAKLAGAHQRQVYRFDSRRQSELVSEVTRTGRRPELICVATFPSLLKPEVLALADAAINLHWSLLPRHRGPDPLFWTYFNDDRTTGVTVHWLSERADDGDILLQKEIELPRGRPLTETYGELTSIGADFLLEAAGLIEGGCAPRIAQSDDLATQEPSPASGTWHIDLEGWPAERLWHVVHGLTRGRGSLLRDEDGALLVHGTARRFEIKSHDKPAGTIEEISGGWRIFCVDGTVDVERPSRQTWIRRILRGLRAPA